MSSLTVFSQQFTFSWRMTLLALCVIGMLLRLGFWQLGRAEEKRMMLNAAATYATQPAIAWKPGMQRPEPYQRIQVHGWFRPEVIFLDNQYARHQWGYHVLSPFELVNHHVILVDRGWVRGDRTRHKLPIIRTLTGDMTIQGSAYFPSKKYWVLGVPIEVKNSKTAVIEAYDEKLIHHFLHKSIEPFIIRLDKNESQGFDREWAIVSMLPQKHDGYALQWFALALVVFIIYITLNFKKK